MSSDIQVFELNGIYHHRKILTIINDKRFVSIRRPGDTKLIYATLPEIMRSDINTDYAFFADEVCLKKKINYSLDLPIFKDFSYAEYLDFVQKWPALNLRLTSIDKDNIQKQVKFLNDLDKLGYKQGTLIRTFVIDKFKD